MPIPEIAKLNLVKRGTYDDTNGDGFASAGDVITYQFEVTNTGTTTLAQVTPVDPGPKFDGVQGEGRLSAFAPLAVTLAPGASQVFTATYELTQADADRAGGKPEAVTNVAVAKGSTLKGMPVLSDEARVVLGLPGVKPGSLTLAKHALTRQVRRGEEAMFRIELTNNGPGSIENIILADTIPAGFRYVSGSAMLDGTPANPVAEGRVLEFPGVKLAVGQTATLELRLLVLASASPGTHINVADALTPGGDKVTKPAQASVVLLAEAVFDCSDIIGKVFDDRNLNGYQDEGEPGLPGSRVVTARGLIITTDEFGRYSVPCAAVPDAQIGSNFILKLDEASLPTGYYPTTENPEVARLTAGKMAEVNFGAALGREVRLDVDAGAFFANSLDPVPPLVEYLPQLVSLLEQQRSVLRLGYLAVGADQLGERRLAALEDMVETLWRRAGRPYELVIDLTVEHR